MRILHRSRPDVDIALLIETAVEGEGILLGPGPDNKVVRLHIALSELAWVRAVSVTGIHWRADREPSDQPAAGDAIDHGEFLRPEGGQVLDRQCVRDVVD